MFGINAERQIMNGKINPDPIKRINARLSQINSHFSIMQAMVRSVMIDVKELEKNPTGGNKGSKTPAG